MANNKVKVHIYRIMIKNVKRVTFRILVGYYSITIIFVISITMIIRISDILDNK